MRKSTLTAGAAAVLALLSAGAVMAQQPGPGRANGADAEGRISRAAFIDSRIARLTALDTNRDGVVSPEERRAGMQARRSERMAARFDALDRNGDGTISREEFTAPREQGADRADRANRGERRHGPRGGHHQRGERGEARGAMTIADVQARLTAQFDRMDTNRDGFVTAEERTAARQAGRTERRGDRMSRRAPAQASPSTPSSE